MIALLVELVVIGLIFYFIEQIPLAAPFPVLIKVVAVIIAIVLVLQFFGLTTGLTLH